MTRADLATVRTLVDRLFAERRALALDEFGRGVCAGGGVYLTLSDAARYVGLKSVAGLRCWAQAHGVPVVSRRVFSLDLAAALRHGGRIAQAAAAHDSRPLRDVSDSQAD